jgi:hypothetical protein
MDVAESAAAGLLGFTIERTNHTEGERFFLENPLLFAANDKGEASDRSTALNRGCCIKERSVRRD